MTLSLAIRRDQLAEDFVKVATVDEIPEGSMKTVEVGNEQAVVANIGARASKLQLPPPNLR